MFKFSIIALSAIGLSNAAVEVPSSVHYIQQQHTQELFQNAIKSQTLDQLEQFSSQQRFAQEQSDISSNSTCPGYPFLWKIIEDATDKHVGFGVGTMHLPTNLVLTDDAYVSTFSAIDDSCDVYGELNFQDAAVSDKLMQCAAPIMTNAATISDIPDEDVRNAYKQKVREIAEAASPIYTDIVEMQLLGLPLFNVQQAILNYNTPEYRQDYLYSLVFGGSENFLDTDILELGRPAESLEQVQTQCNVLKSLIQTPKQLKENPEETSKQLLAALDTSLTNSIQKYKCGDIDEWVADFSKSLEAEIDNSVVDILLDNRNVEMATNIHRILSHPDSNSTKTMFAVGNAHWLIGDKSIEHLLKEYGYRLERIKEWSQDDAEDAVNADCDVIYDPTKGYFVPTSAPATPVNKPKGHYFYSDAR